MGFLRCRRVARRIDGEVYKNQRAFDAHIGAAHTIQFRTDLQQFIGAPYDERLYSVLRH